MALLTAGMGTRFAAPLRAQDATQDRIVALADTEVLRAITVALVAARSMHATNAQYLAAVQPYAPLDLQIDLAEHRDRVLPFPESLAQTECCDMARHLLRLP